MAPMPFTPAQADRLLAAARSSIRHGLLHGQALRPDPSREDLELVAPRAVFVTLHLDGQLRGCIGTLEADEPLVCAAAHYAYAAAFQDPRFPPVAAHEVDRLDVHLSVLTPPEPFPCASEADLIARLRPGQDGLILEEGYRRATFLPSVWSELPRAADFVRHLKRKGGWPADDWSDAMRVQRYTAVSIGESPAKP